MIIEYLRNIKDNEALKIYENLSDTTKKEINKLLDDNLVSMIYNLDPEEEEASGSVIEELMYLNLYSKVETLNWFTQACILNRQHPIGKYRADMVLSCLLNNGRFFNIAIECDGHEYHNKNKKQVQRDKERDRFFALEGYQIMRFSGSEIVADPEKCANEVLKLASKLKKHLEEI